VWLVGGPLALSVPDSLDSVANAKRVNAAAIFVIADADWVVPAAYQESVVRAYGGPKQVIHVAAASHTARVSGPALDELQAAMDRLFRSGISGRVDGRSSGR
jgi:hypothetical protein